MNRTHLQLLRLIGLIAVLDVAAVLGMAHIAGFELEGHQFEHAQWWWGPGSADSSRTALSRHGLALAGMALCWAADMFSLWAATAAFGFHMTTLSVIVCPGTGNAVDATRRALAGPGMMTVALVPTLWHDGALRGRDARLAAYRIFTRWAPLPWSLAAIA